VGLIRKGQGMMIHMQDCPTIAMLHGSSEEWLDVEWAPELRGQFHVNIRLVVSNRRGVLAKIASTIAETGSNIENVHQVPGESNDYTDMHFTLQVSHRLHLAEIMRGLRRIPEVMRINRVKDWNAQK
jgi:GTP pyrophosphokinase